MYRIQNRRAIINRRALLRELDELVRFGAASPRARAGALQIFKAGLYRGVGEVKRRFEDEHIGGCEVVQANAYLVDQLVRALYDFASRHVYKDANRTSDPMAIVATGGYGRGELSPFSDIDLMFVLPPKRAHDAEAIIEYILYMLWDVGLKVGHATRTVNECVQLAREDMTIRTSMIEARWLWGDCPLYDDFERRFDEEVVAGSGTFFVDSKLEERDSRHERMGDSRYVLEPHIKEGKGGLRDLQTLFWIAKYLYRVKDVGELVERGVFTLADVRQFRKSLNFLWTVRCHLHYVAGRPEERLTFNVQELIANRMEYADRPGNRGVERFMKHYFHVTKTVGDLTRVLCAVLEEDQKKGRRRFRLPGLSLFRRTPAGLVFDGDRLMIDGLEALKRDPVLMLRLFHEAQRLEVDVHPRAMRMVQQNLRLIDGSLRNSPVANRLFLEMLTSPDNAETTLKWMSDAGVLGRFVPDFGRVIAQMQYDMYHVYTVDEHTIRAIGILNRIENGALKDQHPTAASIIGELRSRRALYLAVFVHDIAKGRGGDHSEVGAQIAAQLAPRLGLDEWEVESVVWLVRNHLLMSRTAFKRDIDDPKTVSDFTQIVQSPERLRMLLVLTNADIRAVGPNIWNAWKEGLLRELFYLALEDMEMSAGQPLRRFNVRVETAKNALRIKLADWDQNELEAMISRGYPDYWVAFDVDEHSRQFELMRNTDASDRALKVMTRQHPNRDVTEVTIYAPDHPGLFAQIACAMALSGASIVDARIATLANSMALDVFYIQDLAGQPFDSEDRMQRLTRRIEAAIVGNLDARRELFARTSALINRTRVFRVAPRVIIDNKASVGNTVIELNGRDRPGFLYDVTSTLTALGLQIISAHISTYGERVVDVFYVRDIFGLKVEQPAKLARIEERLLEAMVTPEEAASQAAE